jgi:hypothetical protein
MRAVVTAPTSLGVEACGDVAGGLLDDDSYAN